VAVRGSPGTMVFTAKQLLAGISQVKSHANRGFIRIALIDDSVFPPLLLILFVPHKALQLIPPYQIGLSV
jgi:hypothetical protein